MVCVFIFELLCDSEDGEDSRERAKRIITRPAGADKGDCYVVHVKETKQFNQIIEYVVLGVSFRLVFRHVSAALEQVNPGYLSGCNESKCLSFIRVALAANTQELKEIPADS